MRRKITNMMILPAVAFVMLLLAGICSCERKPLYLAGATPTHVEVSVYDIDLELYFGFDWRTQWQYDWDSTKYGPIGYTMPEWVRATIYNREQAEGMRKSPFIKTFSKGGGRVSLTSASWYDMLFYSAGTEYILFDQAADNNYEYYHATTRRSSSPNYSRAFTRQFVDYNQPDELFGTFMEKLWVSDNPDDYEVIKEEDGTIVYLYKIDAVMQPYTFIYLVQVMVLNNTDSIGRRIVGCRGMTLGGLSQGTNLFTRTTFRDEVSISTEDVKPLQVDRELRLPNGEESIGDIFASRVLTWGLPNTTPLVNRAQTQTYSSKGNELGLGLVLRNNAVYNMTKDITEQMESHIKGGVITVVIDSREIPDSIITPTPHPGGGGFNASVEQWGNECNAEIVI